MTADSQQPSPFAAGLKGRCPRCGEGHIFSGFLRIADQCDNCGLDFDFADSGDGPAILIMFPVGTIVVILWLVTDSMFRLPVFVHLALWLPMTVLLSLLMLRPFKGAMVNLQYKVGALPGGGPGDREN